MSSGRQELIIVRSLTSSDLGIFAAHRAAATSKQRAININSNVAAQILSPALFEAGGTQLDCVCHFGDYSARAPRHFGKVGKNWRLGGNKIEGQAFADIDSVDFALLRTVAGNDGSFPVSLTFISRNIMPTEHARVVVLTTELLKQSMAVVTESDAIFSDLSLLAPKPPLPVGEVKAPVGRKVLPPAAKPVPPMPETEKAARGPRTIKEKLRSPHIIQQMLRVSGDLSAPAQVRFMDTVGQMAFQLREVLLRTGGIVKLEKDHAGVWNRVAGHKIGFVDGGMANLSMLGSVPIAVRVGGYVVTPGDRSDSREQFITLKKLIAELYAESEAGVYGSLFPDVGALRDAARISVEAAGAVSLLRTVPDIAWLFMHGALVNPVSRYTDVMREEKTAFAFPHFSAAALEHLVPGDQSRTGREANFISIYLRQLELLQQSDAVVCGVVERESHTTSVIRALLTQLDDREIQSMLPLPAAEWKRWFLSTIDPVEEEDGDGQRITDPLLLRCVLEPGEALRPVRIDRNELRRAPKAWIDKISQYPVPLVSYLMPTEWNAPIRLEMFERDRERFVPTASLVLHCALLLPRYAFPVGLDIVDKYAKIPNWMSRPINTNTTVQALKRAMDSGDTRLFDALRRMLCGSEREWLLRPAAR